MEKFAIMVVITPILMAILAGLSNKFIIPWSISIISTSIGLLLSIALLFAIGNKVTLYNVGNWEAPYGIQLRFDSLSFIMLILINLISLMTIIHSNGLLTKSEKQKNFNLFYCVLLIFSAGLSGIVVSNDLFNIYVFLEITALSTYTLIASNKKKASLLASFDYLIMGTLGSTFYLLGLGFLYAMTGTLNMTDMSNIISYQNNTNTIFVGIILMIVGISIKSAIFPMHNWVVGAYAFSPRSFTPILSGIGTKINIYIMLRMLYCVFDISTLYKEIHINNMFIMLSCTGIIVCSLVATKKNNVRLILANSSIAQMAYITICIAINTSTSLMAAILHIINHSIAKASLFMTISNIEKKTNSDLVTKLIMPSSITSTIDTIVFFIASFSIIGFPFTIGFLSKWQLISASINAKNNVATISIIFGSIIAIYYFGRIALNIKIFNTSNKVFSINSTNKINFYLYIPPILLVATLILISLFGLHVIDIITETTKQFTQK